MSNPKRTYDLMNALTAQFGADKFVMHLHDTRGLALANTLAAMQLASTSLKPRPAAWRLSLRPRPQPVMLPQRIP